MIIIIISSTITITIIITYITTYPPCTLVSAPCTAPRLRGWWNTDVALFEISNSMKSYPTVFHACTSKLRPMIGFFEPQKLDEVSNCIPPTSHRRSLFGPQQLSEAN